MGKKPQQSQLEIGVRIRSARLARKMSQAELAERAGISLSHVSEVETGKTDMRLSHFVKIDNRSIAGISGHHSLC